MDALLSDRPAFFLAVVLSCLLPATGWNRHALSAQEPIAVLGRPELVNEAQAEKKNGPADKLLPPPKEMSTASPPPWSRPSVEPDEELLPINLPSALKLANARAWDILIAQEQLNLAIAQHQEAKVLWIPSLMTGLDYVPKQVVSTNAATDAQSTTSTSSLAVGMTPYALLNITDAVFTPLARRQDARSQQASVQTATNDTLTGVAVAYFNAQEAQADLAAFDIVLHLVDEVVRKTKTLAAALVPEVELNRMLALQANLEQGRENARMQWRLASAELARVLRLTPTVVVQPLEPPSLQVTLVPTARTPNEMIPLALRNRPELGAYEAQVAAAEQRLRQEKFRPFLPILVLQGNSTSTPYPLAVNYFSTITDSSTGASSTTHGFDNAWDGKALWELKNLGFGNYALIRQRQTSVQLARKQEFRFRDIVAKEVTEMWTVLRAANRRTEQSGRELKQAWLSASKQLQILGETNRAEKSSINVLIIRPQEVSAAMQALIQAYYNYYGAVADYNRTQFRLFRALGSPAQQLHDHEGPFAPALVP